VTRAPVRYWDEYVATDNWYLKALVDDIHPDEQYAALEDSDLDDVEILSDKEDANSEDSEQEDERTAGDTATEASVLGSSEGESGSEGSDGESEGSTVG
jgi:hypothetical protein